MAALTRKESITTASGVRFASFGTDEIGLQDNGCIKFLPSAATAPAWRLEPALLGENFGPSPSVFEAELLALCPQRGEPLLERGNDVIADLGRREGDPVYKPTPTIDLIFGADDHLIGIAIHSDEALRLLDLLHQISDGHALVSTGGLGDRAQRCSNILPEAGWRQLSSDPAG